MADKDDIPADAAQAVQNLRYEIYDPARVSPRQQDWLDQLGHLKAFHERDFVVADNFGDFSLLNEVGWPRVAYQSFHVPGGYLYWITDQHAEMIGRALRPGLKELNLELTTLAGDGFSLMARAVTGDIRLDSLIISHQSGDAVTDLETIGLARLATRLRAKTLHLWASEFAGGALDALAREMGALKNQDLTAVEICDVSENPVRPVPHPVLEELAKHNKEAKSRQTLPGK